MFECLFCPWRDRNHGPVPPEGPADARIMVVGRNPGITEDAQGRPFVGKAGVILDRFLADAGLQRDRIYITNTAKCYGGAGDPCPTEAVYNACESVIQHELNTLKPALIIPLGADAYRRLTGDVSPIGAVQGTRQTVRNQAGRVYFPVSHPSYWLRLGTYYDRVIRPIVIPALRACLIDLRLVIPELVSTGPSMVR